MNDIATPVFHGVDDEVERLVKQIEIPPCPAILTRIVREMQADEPDLNKVAQGVSADVALSAAMLKTVNSPFYGLRNKANSVQQALILLGLRNVGQLVTGLLLRQAFPVTASDAMERFWNASSGEAMATAMIARELKVCDPNLAYTFGLFRDAGMPALLSKYKAYEPIMTGEANRPGVPLPMIEMEKFGVHHAQVGAYFASSWHLDEAVWLAILLHHDYPKWLPRNKEMPVRMAAMGLIAEQVYVRNDSKTDCDEWDQGADAALEILGIDGDRVLEFEAEFAAQRAN
ncbi:MAG TPA: HDOD domain-containing protein [Burkholderiales bacterium]|nr:HDOD domain-containing protein [Burkholderiales bacterium]